jgi:hypothetical protein
MKTVSAWPLVLIGLLVVACDAVHVINGRILSAPAGGRVTGSLRSETGAPLEGVEVAVFVESNGKRTVSIYPVKSDANGAYQIEIVSAPRLSDRVYVEFRKQGFETVQVFPRRDGPPANTEKTQCRQAPYTECWKIDVAMSPVP